MVESGSVKPEWIPDNPEGGTYASEVKPGVEGGHDGMPGMTLRKTAPVRRKPALQPAEAVAGVLAGDRTILARAITLIESRAAAHQESARAILRECLPHAGKSIRIGITGVPGAGKSTFIEAFGSMLCEQGHKVAVLAVDPSSSVHGGSVLGDKTRMEDLSRHPHAFIRPSPSGGTLGGVAAKTRESLLLCEAAGFDVVLVETVGVGQSEVAVRSMVDFFLLLQIAGAGDELQGIKKGVIEMADAIVVNKADGDNIPRANLARVEYSRVLHFLHPFTPGWSPRALTCSALHNEGVEAIWEEIARFRRHLEDNSLFERRRREQNRQWFHTLLREAVLGQFHRRPEVIASLPSLETRVAAGEIPVLEAVEELLGKSTIGAAGCH
jgi:LAO/AO transport system kinase